MSPYTAGTFLHIIFDSTQRFRAPSQLRSFTQLAVPTSSAPQLVLVYNPSEMCQKQAHGIAAAVQLQFFNHIHAANISSNQWFITELADGRKASHFMRLWQLGTFRDVERGS